MRCGLVRARALIAGLCELFAFELVQVGKVYHAGFAASVTSPTRHSLRGGQGSRITERIASIAALEMMPLAACSPTDPTW